MRLAALHLQRQATRAALTERPSFSTVSWLIVRSPADFPTHTFVSVIVNVSLQSQLRESVTALDNKHSYFPTAKFVF